MGVEDCVTTELFFMVPFGAFVLICFYYAIALCIFRKEQWQKIYYGTMAKNLLWNNDYLCYSNHY